MIRPLGETLEDDAPRRHVDPEAHRLGGEHHPDEPALEEDLGEPLEAGQDARVVEPDTLGEGLEDRLVQRGGLERRARLHRLADRLLDLASLGAVEERLALGEELLHRPLAAGPAEDEVDRG